eukprot:CAMPEP_0175422234 /NCGR_PEP_ID=MMETSP0095-20121207/47652_1 /TAXON_ID=311494 /ORGANISM="Alexandrium monilatum, Strain CCMP3105" /LENGTH=113 /DNA_ID=CAMNT_0016721475 /DNA_START=24 /DNA_END=362 /DNA_ORIENTATION=+
MGNCECLCDIGHNPITTEQLEKAVRELNVPEARRLLESGVHPNSPIDEDDHTVMDVLLNEHEFLFKEMHKHKLKGDLHSRQIMDLFEKQHGGTYEMFKLLRDYGAEIHDRTRG